MSSQNKRLLWVLLIIGAALHLFRLADPGEVVFDEVHFGGFVESYCCSGKYFFDIHPPHAKLLVASIVKLGGYQGGQSFVLLGTPITELNPALLRAVPAVTGILIPALLFILMLQLKASPWAAFLAGWAAALDNALLVQTRLVALDGILIVSIFSSVSCALAGVRARTRIRQAGLCLASGSFIGLAVGTKLTGLVSAASVLAILANEVWRHGRPWRSRRLASQLVWGLSGAVGVYVGGWALHFALLGQSGPGDVWGPPSGNFIVDTIRVHQTMFGANYGLDATHPYSSPWWSWPLMLRSVYYWSGDESVIYLLGNPVVWWGTTLGLVGALLGTILLRVSNFKIAGSNAERRQILWLPTFAYLVAFLPFIVIPRALFLYHYLSALLFAICLVFLWLDRIGWTRAGGLRDQRRSVIAGALLIALGFIAISPLSYGFLDAPDYLERVFSVFPRWR